LGEKKERRRRKKKKKKTYPAVPPLRFPAAFLSLPLFSQRQRQEP
jgi:hypothetical protein